MSDPYGKMEEAVQGTALPTFHLLDETFTIESFRMVKTQYGNRCVATVRWPPDAETTEEAWLSGVVLFRQLDSIKDDLPVTVRLTRDKEPNSPYVLVKPSEGKLVEAAKEQGARQVRRKDALADFRMPSGRLDMHAFVRWWKEQDMGPDDLVEVIGDTLTDKALEAWFQADSGRTLETLIDTAVGATSEGEESTEAG